MTIKLPSALEPVAGSGGNVTPSWFRFFASLAAGSQAVSAVTVTASPFAYASPSNGSLSVSGGTVSAISLKRGNTAVALGVAAGLLPAATGDTFTITYTVAPTVTFLPG